MKLKINPEYKRIVPKHIGDDSDRLKESLSKYGYWKDHPIIHNPKGIVLDGHTRLELCAELNLIPSTKMRSFKDPLEEKRFVIECNLSRRHLSTYQKAELVMELMKIEAIESKKRMKSGTKAPDGTRGKTTEKVAKKHGMSTRTLERAKVIMESDDEVLKDKVRSGKMSISYGERMIKNKKYHETETPPLPNGEFALIEMDFPWKYDLELSGAPDYHTMTLDEGKEEIPKLPAHKNCVLFMWVTNPKIEEALALVNFWGFTLKTSMFWVKTKNGKPEPDQLQVGTGHYVKGAHEMLWICIKGKPGTPHNIHQFPSVFFAPRGKHSVKPDLAYEIIVKMYPKAKRLSMFSRTERQGWTVWGDSIEKKK